MGATNCPETPRQKMITMMISKANQNKTNIIQIYVNHVKIQIYYI